MNNKVQISLLIMGLCLFCGCVMDVESTKDRLQGDYIKFMVRNSCSDAEDKYNEMVKIDPYDEYPMVSYNEADYSAAIKNAPDPNVFTEEDKRIEKSYKRRYRNLHDHELFKLKRKMEKQHDQYLKAKYSDPKVITYTQLKQYVDFCKAGNSKAIPIEDLQNSIEMKEDLTERY
ncbi:MAG: hypothetical protein AB7V50_05250 [Vampirovibrionia bacterium]